MSLFGKTEVDSQIIPFIKKGEGVGVVNVEAYGKASARMESYKIIFESYNDKNPIIESVSAINYLSYNKGNFFKEPKLEIGISHKKYILSGVDNNDEELESFYKTLLNIKNLEKEQKSSHGFSRPVVDYDLEEEIVDLEDELDIIEEDHVSEDENSNEEETVIEELDEIDELEKELASEEESDDAVDEENDLDSDDEVLDDTSFLQNVNNESDEDFEVLEEELIEEDREVIEETTETDESQETEPLEDNEEIIDETPQEEISGNGSEDVEEDLTTDSSDEADENSEEKDELVEFDEELEEIIDEEMDLDRVINDSDDEIIIEEDLTDEDSAEEVIDEENLETEEESKSVDESNSDVESKSVEESKQEVEKETLQQTVTNENASEQLGQMKQQLYQGINNIQEELTVENKVHTPYIPTYRQLDPVDQIRRYYELKEDGIITEEEFEQKKKQLLDL